MFVAWLDGVVLHQVSVRKFTELQTLPTKKDMSSYVRVLARAEESEARSSLFFAAMVAHFQLEQSNLAS